MKNKYIAFTLLTTPLLSAASAYAQNEAGKPNVIIILADDLGYGDLECYGAKNVKTPHVNKLAKQGIRFTDGHAVAATSTPSRYSMLTGEYSWRRPDTDVAAGNAGMIIKPARNATPVSKISIWWVEFSMEISFFI